MPRNHCEKASLSWCPLSGTRLEARISSLTGYRIFCTKRLRREALLISLRPSQNSDRECSRPFSFPACQSIPVTRWRSRAGVIGW
jgi:hypothetical protein